MKDRGKRAVQAESGCTVPLSRRIYRKPINACIAKVEDHNKKSGALRCAASSIFLCAKQKTCTYDHEKRHLGCTRKGMAQYAG